MTTYTYSEARQNLANLLEKAKKEGKILIKRKDGSTFIVQPFKSNNSPFDIEGINLEITSDEISDIIREVRER